MKDTIGSNPVIAVIAAARAALDLLENPDADSFDASRVEAQLRAALALIGA